MHAPLAEKLKGASLRSPRKGLSRSGTNPSVPAQLVCLRQTCIADSVLRVSLCERMSTSVEKGI